MIALENAVDNLKIGVGIAQFELVAVFISELCGGCESVVGNDLYSVASRESVRRDAGHRRRDVNLGKFVFGALTELEGLFADGFQRRREDQAFKAVRDSEALISDRGHSLGDDDLLYILRVRECGIPKRAESRRENYLSQRLLIAVERELSDRGVALWNDELRSLALGKRVVADKGDARRDIVDPGPLLAPEEA